MYLMDYVKAREGKIWTDADSAEVHRVIRQIESVAEAVVQRQNGSDDSIAAKKRCQCAIEDYRDLPSGDTCLVCKGEVTR